VVLLIRGVMKGDSSALLARELGLARSTVMQIRHLLQASALSLLPQGQLKDEHSETDELFQNAGEKR
jgi:hypothetical protein